MRYLDCYKHVHIKEKLDTLGPKWWATNAGEHWMRCLKHFQDYEAPFKQLSELMKFDDMQPRVLEGLTIDNIQDEYYERISIAARHPRCCFDDIPVISLKPFHYAFDSLFIFSPA
jgi:hypothetical protein